MGPYGSLPLQRETSGLTGYEAYTVIDFVLVQMVTSILSGLSFLCIITYCDVIMIIQLLLLVSQAH